MKNKNRPFFYEKKKTSFGKILLTILGIVFIVTLAGYQIPGIRQRISEPLFAAGSLILNGTKEIINKTRMYHEPEKKRQTYDPIELPDKEVLFAESLENLSAISQEDPLADLRQTPTPSEYSRVAAWEYLDPNLNYAVNSNGQPLSGAVNVKLIPPVFEHRDLFNDGPAILSACLRYWGIVANQYEISHIIHPKSTDPFVSFDDLQKYVTENVPDLQVLIRINGDKDTVVGLLKAGIPVILKIQQKSIYPYWINDDHMQCRYVLVLGYDSENKVFNYQDTAKGNTLEIGESELLSDWYPYQREYMVIYPEEKDTEVREVLSENYFEELNLQRALTKYRTDSELLPNNPYAQYNFGVVLHMDGDNNGAWELFEMAEKLLLPQRFMAYQTDMLQTALELGYGDDLERLTSDLLAKNPDDEVLTVYRGWAEILRKDYLKGEEFFNKAYKINPNSDAVIYAIKYKDTMLNY